MHAGSGFTSSPVPALRWLALALLLPAAPGCDILDRFEDSGGLINLYVTHHATPRDGEFPDYGAEKFARQFETDLGWSITLSEAYVTVTSVAVLACSGQATNVDLYWGPCAEDFIETPDVGGSGIGAVDVTASNYCALLATFAPFSFEQAQAEDPSHDLPQNELVDGTTVFLRGRAEKEGEEPVVFEWSTGESLDVTLDLSALENGGPVVVEHDSPLPAGVTIGKPYDRFFSGIDFASFSDADLEAAVFSALENDARAHLGSQASPESAAK